MIFSPWLTAAYHLRTTNIRFVIYVCTGQCGHISLVSLLSLIRIVFIATYKMKVHCVAFARHRARFPPRLCYGVRSSLTLCKKEYFCLLFNGFAINVFAGKKLIK